jgi:hypothetical protein
VLVIYRTNGADGSGKCRPEGFSKLACLRSLVASAESSTADLEFLTLADGPTDEARLRIAGELGPVRRLPGLGNGKSSRYALHVAAKVESHDSFFFIEDDFFMRPDCLDGLVRGLAELPQVDYVSPYDHPDRYRRTDDWGTRRQRIWFDGVRHWRSVESNTSTFAGRVERLRKDLPIHLLACMPPTPQGRYRWRTLTQVPLIHGTAGRAVFATPMPSLATHVELDQFSPGMTFEEFAGFSSESA